MGAWIETRIFDGNKVTMIVAPYVGAWIETDKYKQTRDFIKSHPTWVRGLKPDADAPPNAAKSRTLRGCVD